MACAPAFAAILRVPFAILMPIMSLFLLGILDYMVTNARVMETVAAAFLPDGDSLLVADRQELLAIWNVTTGAAVCARTTRIVSPSEARSTRSARVITAAAAPSVCAAQS